MPSVWDSEETSVKIVQSRWEHCFFSIKKNLTRKQAKRKETNFIYSVSFLEGRHLEGVVKRLKVKHAFSKCKAAMLMFNRATIRLENGIGWIHENYTLTGSSSFSLKLNKVEKSIEKNKLYSMQCDEIYLLSYAPN